MSCTSLKGIIKLCKGNQGGIQAIYINDSDNVINIGYDVETHIINSIDITTSFIEFDLTRNTCNAVIDPKVDLINHTTYFETKINLVFNRRQGSTSRPIQLLGEGQRHLDIIFLDMNGLYWYVNKVQLESGSGDTGVVLGDGSKYRVTFIGQEEWRPYEVNPNIIPDLMNNWILRDGDWRDLGIWIDEEVWID